MRNFLLLLISALSLNVFSQVKTGTGGSHNPHEGWIKPIDNENLDPGNSAVQGLKLLKFVSSLDMQEQQCRSKGHRYIDSKKSDFMQVYLKLSVLKSSFEADDKCQDVGAYFKCLSSDQVKKDLKEVTDDKKMKQYLKRKYNIDNKDAKDMLRFFKSLDKGCDKGACQM